MAVYMADENGDWWGTNGKSNTLYVLDTKKLTLAEKIQILDEWGDGFTIGEDDPNQIDEMLEDVWEQDKFERVIQDFGKEIEVKF